MPRKREEGGLADDDGVVGRDDDEGRMERQGGGLGNCLFPGTEELLQDCLLVFEKGN